MTDDDIVFALDVCVNDARRDVDNAAPATGLTATSRKRLES
nr:hypothetical protein [Mycolicibacterium komanii]